jgi:putative transposase
MAVDTAGAFMLGSLERQILEDLVARRRSAQGMALRARIVLLAAEGQGVKPTARELHVDEKTVQLWRRRWAQGSAEWKQSAGEDWEERVWRGKIEQALADRPRSGAPATFSAEQVCQIIALACKDPKDLGLPITHWSAADLQRQVLKEKIVPSISPRQVGRFLKDGGPQAPPHAVLPGQR